MALSILFTCAAIASPCINISEADIENTKSALEKAEKGDWKNAWAFAKKAKDPVIGDIILWLKYKSNDRQNSFSEISAFIEKHPHWPEQIALRKAAEYSLGDLSDERIVKWFQKHPAFTSTGLKAEFKARFALLNANQKESHAETIKLLKRVWVESDFSQKEEQEFLQKYRKFLSAEDYQTRTSNLLWQKKIDQAIRNIDNVDPSHQKLFQARISLQQNKSVPQALTNVPQDLKNDYGLIYDLISWYDRKGERAKADNLLLKVKSPSDHEQEWWAIKKKIVRNLMDDRNYQTAYKLVERHNNKNNTDYADAEWLAGWIAFRFLGDNNKSYQHFSNLYQNVKSPMSLSRAAYWAGRVCEKNGKEAEAKAWYQKAAYFPWVFYGQLSVAKLKAKFELPTITKATATQIANYKYKDLLKVAYILAKANRTSQAKIFIKAAVKAANSKSEAILVTEIVSSFKNVHLTTESAKHVANEKLIFLHHGYPTLAQQKTSKLEKALAHAIIRQESVFDKYAQSSAGALGLMQLLPTTAKDIANELKIKFNHLHLKSDPHYNITLGSHFLNKLVENFDGSYILAVAAYNAGPTNVKKWLKTYGDPRQHKNVEDVIDWVESVPFYETRNYIQRVLENLQIYRSVTEKAAHTMSLTIEQDLKR
jgi:soluble lytic murein transglycosylase